MMRAGRAPPLSGLTIILPLPFPNSPFSSASRKAPTCHACVEDLGVRNHHHAGPWWVLFWKAARRPKRLGKARPGPDKRVTSAKDSAKARGVPSVSTWVKSSATVGKSLKFIGNHWPGPSNTISSEATVPSQKYLPPVLPSLELLVQGYHTIHSYGYPDYSKKHL